MLKPWFLFLLSIIFVASPTDFFAQADQANPFDLKQRIQKNSIVKDTVAKGPINPFDIDRAGVIPRDEHIVEFNDPSFFKKGWKVGRSIFWVFIFLLFFLATLIPFARNTISSFYRGVSGAGPFNILFRGKFSFFKPVGIGLYLFYFFNLGLFFYLVGQHFGYIKGESLQEFALLSLLVGFLSLLKHFSIWSLGSIFPVAKDSSKFRFLMGVFNSLLGLFIFPVNLILAYGAENLRLPAIYIAIGVGVVLYIYRYVLGTSNASPKIIRNKFNFFMYLCTLEIAPVLVLAKYLLDSKGLEILQ